MAIPAVRTRSMPSLGNSQSELDKDDVADLKSLINDIKNEKKIAQLAGETSKSFDDTKSQIDEDKTESPPEKDQTEDGNHTESESEQENIEPASEQTAESPLQLASEKSVNTNDTAERSRSTTPTKDSSTEVEASSATPTKDSTKEAEESLVVDDDKTILKVTILSSIQETCFYLPVCLLIDREREMRTAAVAFGIDHERWPGSFLYRRWQAMRLPNGKVGNSQEIRLKLDPENDCSASNQSHNLKWRPWLTNCIRSYYNTGTLRISDQSIGSDILLALEYFGIVYSPDQLVFDSFAAYLRVKLWSDYFTHRSAMANWIVNQLHKLPSRHSQTFVTCPDENDCQVSVRSKTAEIFEADLDLDLERYGDLPSRAVVYDFFNDEDLDDESQTKMVLLMRADFATYLQSLLPGTSVAFAVTEASVFRSTGISVSRRRAVLHIDYRTKCPSPAPTVNLPFRIGGPMSPFSTRDADSIRTGSDDEFSGVHKIIMFSPNPNIGRKPPRARKARKHRLGVPPRSASTGSPPGTPPKVLPPMPSISLLPKSLSQESPLNSRPETPSALIPQDLEGPSTPPPHDDANKDVVENNKSLSENLVARLASTKPTLVPGSSSTAPSDEHTVASDVPSLDIPMKSRKYHRRQKPKKKEDELFLGTVHGEIKGIPKAPIEHIMGRGDSSVVSGMSVSDVGDAVPLRPLAYLLSLDSDETESQASGESGHDGSLKSGGENGVAKQPRDSSVDLRSFKSASSQTNELFMNTMNAFKSLLCMDGGHGISTHSTKRATSVQSKGTQSKAKILHTKNADPQTPPTDESSGDSLIEKPSTLRKQATVDSDAHQEQYENPEDVGDLALLLVKKVFEFTRCQDETDGSEQAKPNVAKRCFIGLASDYDSSSDSVCSARELVKKRMEFKEKERKRMEFKEKERKRASMSIPRRGSHNNEKRSKSTGHTKKRKVRLKRAKGSSSPPKIRLQSILPKAPRDPRSINGRSRNSESTLSAGKTTNVSFSKMGQGFDDKNGRRGILMSGRRR